MAHNLSDEAEAFLAQDQLVTVDAIRDDSTIIPAAPGIYGWWFDNALAELLSKHMVCSELTESKTNRRHIARQGFELSYVGISPSAASKVGIKSRALRDRLLNHCRGPLATSTLRRTLAALLRVEETLTIKASPSGKAQMSLQDEAKLTRWMSEHGRITWVTNAAPGLIEKELLDAEEGPRLPLNIRGASGALARLLTRIRIGAIATRPPRRRTNRLP
jgi:hypothetical protein